MIIPYIQPVFKVGEGVSSYSRWCIVRSTKRKDVEKYLDKDSTLCHYVLLGLVGTKGVLTVKEKVMFYPGTLTKVKSH